MVGPIFLIYEWFPLSPIELKAISMESSSHHVLTEGYCQKLSLPPLLWSSKSWNATSLQHCTRTVLPFPATFFVRPTLRCFFIEQVLPNSQCSGMLASNNSSYFWIRKIVFSQCYYFHTVFMGQLSWFRHTFWNTLLWGWTGNKYFLESITSVLLEKLSRRDNC